MDRRVVELQLTPAGDAIINELLPLVVDQTNAALAPLSKSEFVQLRSYLVRLLDHAQESNTVPAAEAARKRPTRKTPNAVTRKAKAARTGRKPAARPR
jgi:hypothetical protein